MRDIDSAMLNAQVSAPVKGLIPRRLVWFTAKDRTSGAAEEIGLWTGGEDLNITVYRGLDGLLVSRPYSAAGNVLSISDIPRVSDFTVQTVTVTLSQLANAAQQLVRQYDLRIAPVEIHEVLIDQATGDQVSPAAIVFLGLVDGAPITTPKVGQDGSVSVKVVSDVMWMLQRANPRKSSYEGQKVRNNDQWGKDSSVVATWHVPWGQKSA